MFFYIKISQIYFELKKGEKMNFQKNKKFSVFLTLSIFILIVSLLIFGFAQVKAQVAGGPAPAPTVTFIPAPESTILSTDTITATAPITMPFSSFEVNFAKVYSNPPTLNVNKDTVNFLSVPVFTGPASASVTSSSVFDDIKISKNGVFIGNCAGGPVAPQFNGVDAFSCSDGKNIVLGPLNKNDVITVTSVKGGTMITSPCAGLPPCRSGSALTIEFTENDGQVIISYTVKYDGGSPFTLASGSSMFFVSEITTYKLFFWDGTKPYTFTEPTTLTFSASEPVGVTVFPLPSGFTCPPDGGTAAGTFCPLEKVNNFQLTFSATDGTLMYTSAKYSAGIPINFVTVEAASLKKDTDYTVTLSPDSTQMTFSPISAWPVGTLVFNIRGQKALYNVAPRFPQGISTVTGTVTVTPPTGGTGALGETLTVTGGTLGGTVTLKETGVFGGCGDLGILCGIGEVCKLGACVPEESTFTLDIPPATTTTLSIDDKGRPRFHSTTAGRQNFLGIKNLALNNKEIDFIKGEDSLTVAINSQKTLRYNQESNGDARVFSEGGSSFTSGTIQCYTTCIAYAPDPKGWCCVCTAWKVECTLVESHIIIAGILNPNEDLIFGNSITPSLDKVLTLGTSTGLQDVQLRSGIGPTFATFSMQPPPDTTGDTLDPKVEILTDDVNGIVAVIPNSPGIKLDASPSTLAGMTFYPVAVRSPGQGKFKVVAPARYTFDVNADKIPDIEYSSKQGNTYFTSVVGSGYLALSTTEANGRNLAVFSLASNLNPLLTTVTFNGVSQTKNIKESEVFNFIQQKDKLGNPVTVAGNSRTITGSLIEEISPAALIEGWNYWYTATTDNYWSWTVALESLPAGCTADKTTASTTVANGVQTLAFYVDCGTATSTTGAVVSGMSTATQGDKGFATKGRAQLLSEFADCTEVLPNGAHKCSQSQQFREEAAEVVKGVMNPTGSTVAGLGSGGGLLILLSILILAGVIVLIVMQVNRKTVDW